MVLTLYGTGSELNSCEEIEYIKHLLSCHSTEKSLSRQSIYISDIIIRLQSSLNEVNQAFSCLVSVYIHPCREGEVDEQLDDGVEHDLVLIAVHEDWDQVLLDDLKNEEGL